MKETQHIAVMTQEVMHALRPQSGGLYIDGTLGGGTHSRELLKATAPDGRVLSLDIDPKALERARDQFSSDKNRWIGVEENFRNLSEVAKDNGFDPCDGIILDLGFSSDELTNKNKGLSFQIDGPLDMRFGPKSNEDGLTAAEIINSWSKNEIAQLLREYGEESFAAKIAEGIVKARKKDRIIGTLDLVSIIRNSVHKNYERGRINPATRTFQALRIAVNDELNALKHAIEGARKILKPGGRIAIISFHSLEDRIVKRAFRDSEDLEAVTKRPIIPSEEEIKHNTRSRSAKLRVAEKII
ncbi:MAG: 16S rRNA (cytosine(1402)-N(4))-methyltransferase RsmH [Patescibacteria group bacterium]|nr:16S rRNA (cytosine(1402)-N(4))-methyltransferase RsmH [Patescibacteria group bacterium]MBU2508911.1 16S rRNA (cytosine(1402)-N(4))-methyltransferase RsmH [Patescibacteria group bacterium]